MFDSFAPLEKVHAFLAMGMAGEPFVYAVCNHLPSHVPDGVCAVRAAYNGGLVELVQRRRPVDDRLDYIAIKRATPARIEGCFRFPRELLGRAN